MDMAELMAELTVELTAELGIELGASSGRVSPWCAPGCAGLGFAPWAGGILVDVSEQRTTPAAGSSSGHRRVEVLAQARALVHY